MVSSYDVVRARSLDPGETLTLARQAWVRVPPGFEAARSVGRPGVEALYREDRPTDALEIRVRRDRLILERCRYNPRYHPGRHLTVDRLPDGATAALRRLTSGLGHATAGVRRATDGVGRVAALLGRRA